MDEINGDITKEGKQSLISRALRPNKDMEKIAIWKLRLNEILRVLYVCPMLRHLHFSTLISPFQAEFKFNSRAITSHVHLGIFRLYTATCI